MNRIKNKKELTDKKIMNLLKKHGDVLKKYKVKTIGLFGSYVRGEQKRHSDIDFLVEFEAVRGSSLSRTMPGWLKCRSGNSRQSSPDRYVENRSVSVCVSN